MTWHMTHASFKPTPQSLRRFYVTVLPSPEDVPEGPDRECCSAALQMGANQMKDTMVATLPDLLEFLELLMGGTNAAASPLEQVDDVPRG